MSSNKKRKLENVPPAQMMSAVALRRKQMEERAKQTADAQVLDGGLRSEGEAESEDRGGLLDAPRRAQKQAVSAKESQKSIPDREGQIQHPEKASERVASSTSLPKAPTSPREPPVLESEPPIPTFRQFSSFKLSSTNHKRKVNGNLALELSDGERLVILGSYGVRLRAGTATISGASLRPSDKIFWVHAPHCNAVPVLRCSDSTSLELLPHPSAEHLRRLANLSPLYRGLWNEKEGKRSSTFKIIHTSVDVPKRAILQELLSPAEWNKELARLSKRSRSLSAFVCGPKSSGKSTFSRLLVNRLTTEETRLKDAESGGVAFLDLDPGQPEFSPPGVISLVHLKEPNLEAAFCHPLLGKNGNRTIKSHAIASVTPATSPEHYVECVLNLHATYRAMFKGQCPLVVNTPGWIQGTGLDILTELIAAMVPSEVVYMSKDGPGETVEALKAVTKKNAFVTLPSQSSEYTSRTAVHLRAMQTMSYFHLEAVATRDSPSKWTSASLSTIAPWKVRYAGPTRGILGIMCYDWQPAPELLAESLNGTVMAVVEVWEPEVFSDLRKDKNLDQGVTDESNEMEVDTEYEQEYPVGRFMDSLKSLVQLTVENLPFIPNPNGRTLKPAQSQVVGLALVRGIDVGQQELQILSPIRAETMNNIGRDGKGIVLVAGGFDTPSWAYMEDLYKQSSARADASKGDTNGRGGEDELEVTEADTEDDRSDLDEETRASPASVGEVPWVEVLHGSQRRAVGSKVWRVRRDLGRSRP